MVSKLYEADKFFKLQKEGKVANSYATDKKLLKDSKGFYLIKNSKMGQYKQRVSKNDYVYSRAEGVTKYSLDTDEKKTDIKTYNKATGKEHIPYRHTSDRKAKTTDRIYRE